MEYPPLEIQENILIRLSVRDLIRCKSVCKSWCKIISRRDFIKSHLKHSYLSDQTNNAFGDRRLVISRWRGFDTGVKASELYDDLGILGSCHGLVCFFHSYANIVVVNPSTTEVKRVTEPQISKSNHGICWGFGYDETTDDYKVFFGYKKLRGKVMCIKVLSLRSNMWKYLGEVNFANWLTFVGVLCKGVLHWIAYDTLTVSKITILSFNLSDETFTVLPEPENVKYQSMIAEHYMKMRLGTLEGCLCLIKHDLLPSEIWVLKDYNNKQSWELVSRENELKPDAVYVLKVSNLIPNTRPFLHDPWFGHIKAILMACTYVESLVSPHIEKMTEEKETDSERHPEQATSIIQSPNWSSKITRYNAHAGSDSSTSASV